MAGEQHGHEREPRATGDGGLGRDVARRVQNTRRKTEPRAAPADRGRVRRHTRDRNPRADCPRRAMRAVTLSRKRAHKHRETGDRDGNAAAFPNGEGRIAGDEQREQPDPSGRRSLHQRQRSERQCGDVQPPADEPDEESGQPPPSAEEEPERIERPAQRERRQRRGGSVLREEPPVQRSRRREREPKAGQKARGHRPLRPAKGRYASAASAAIPTLGRSSRRS